MKLPLKILTTNAQGVIVKNLKTKLNQFIPYEIFIRRIQWGIYEISNPDKIPSHIS